MVDRAVFGEGSQATGFLWGSGSVCGKRRNLSRGRSKPWLGVALLAMIPMLVATTHTRTAAVWAVGDGAAPETTDDVVVSMIAGDDPDAPIYAWWAGAPCG